MPGIYTINDQCYRKNQLPQPPRLSRWQEIAMTPYEWSILEVDGNNYKIKKKNQPFNFFSFDFSIWKIQFLFDFRLLKVCNDFYCLLAHLYKQ